jgi:hypothetical protein
VKQTERITLDKCGTRYIVIYGTLAYIKHVQQPTTRMSKTRHVSSSLGYVVLTSLIRSVLYLFKTYLKGRKNLGYDKKSIYGLKEV